MALDDILWTPVVRPTSAVRPPAVRAAPQRDGGAAHTAATIRRPPAPSQRCAAARMAPGAFRRLVAGWAIAVATLLAVVLALRWLG